MDLNNNELAMRLSQLNSLSVEIGYMQNISLLLERILDMAKNVTYADGGTLYQLSKDKKSLDFHIVINESLGIYQGGSSGQAINIPSIPLWDEKGEANMRSVAAYAVHTGQSVNIPNVYESEFFDFSGMRQFDKERYYYSRSFLTVPMRDHEGHVIGILQLINAQHPLTGMTHPFSPEDQCFIEALTSQAAIAMSRQALISRLDTLFESFVSLIALTANEQPVDCLPSGGRTLTEALQALDKFQERHQIPMALYESFVRKKVYPEYARHFNEPIEIRLPDESLIAP